MGNTMCHSGSSPRPSYYPINATAQQQQWRTTKRRVNTAEMESLSPTSFTSLLTPRGWAFRGVEIKFDSRGMDSTPTGSGGASGSGIITSADSSSALKSTASSVVEKSPQGACPHLVPALLVGMLLLMALGVSAYAIQDFLPFQLPKLPLLRVSAWSRKVPEASSDQPLPSRESAVQLSVRKPVKPACCADATAKCLACKVGLSIERYCLVDVQAQHVVGCEEALANAALAAPSTSAAATQDVVPALPRRPGCCTETTAQCQACALDVSLQEYCTREDIDKAPGCEEEVEAQTRLRGHGDRRPRQAADGGQDQQRGSRRSREEEEMLLAQQEHLMEEQYERMQEELQEHERKQLARGFWHERPSRDCCSAHRAECLACLAGLTLSQYCAKPDAHKVLGCKEQAARNHSGRLAPSTTSQMTVIIKGIPLGEATARSTSTTPTPDGLSLFCISLMLPWGYEPELLKKQFASRKSIFACNEPAVYSSTVMELGEGFHTANLGIDLHCKYGGKFYTVLNTPIFLVLWQRLAKDGRFRHHDWTVKVDPDAVFFPWRLRRVLTRDKMSAQVGNGMFLNNCGYGLHGPLEVLSRRAIEVYDGHAHVCEKPPQEDVYLQKCLLQLGVLQVNHFNLLAEAHCSFEDWAQCGSDHVSFHPFKDWSAYERCLTAAESQNPDTRHPEG